MGLWLADVRFALRMMVKNAGFTAVAVVALALGIGANSAIFTVVKTVLLDPLPYREPDRIMRVGREFEGHFEDSNSIPKYMAWRDNQAFKSLTLRDMAVLAMNFGSGDPPVPVNGLHVSSGYFDVFGVAPLLGRTFSPNEDLPHGPAVAVVSYGFWQGKLSGDPSAVGRAILLNGAPFTLVGVLPAGFLPDPAPDVWLPLQADPNSTNQGHYLSVEGRLKPGLSVAAAKAQMRIVGEQFRKANPKWMDAKESVGVVPLREAMVGDVRPALLVLLGAVALVLLIACANVANLLLARAAVRQREMAIRAAVGASRGRVIRQLLTESVLLAFGGAILGFGLGVWGVRTLMQLVPGNSPRLTGRYGAHATLPLLDLKVAGFTIAVAILTGVLFGLFPALQISKPDLASVLKESSGRTGTGWRQNRARAVLVVAEIALALVLLVGAVLLIRSFAGLQSVNPGIDPRNVLTLQTALSPAYNTSAKVDRLTTQVVRRIESLPGVEMAASSAMLPVDGGADLPFTIAGKPPTDGDYTGEAQWRPVSPHFFGAFRVPILRGRGFTDTDTASSAHVVVINQAMAKQFWKNEDPVGQVIVIGKGLGPQFEEAPRQVVGVIGNIRERGLARGEIAAMYIPESQTSDGLTALINSAVPKCWEIRTTVEPLSLRAAVERELRAVDPQLPVSSERTMEQVISETIARQSFNTLLLSIFAAVAMLLAAIGIYGLMAYSVEQRSQEIGIRMALGGGRAEMLRMVLLQAMRLAGAGVMLGLGIAWGASRLLATLLFGVKATDPVTFAVVGAALLLVALVAVVAPARKAASMQPLEALRYE